MREQSGIEDEGTLGLGAWIGQSRGMTVAHQHLDLEINYVLSHTIRYLIGGSIVELPRNRICVLWGGIPHQMIRNPEFAEAIWVTVPLTSVLRWGLPDLFIRPLLSAGFIADVAPLESDLSLLKKWVDDLGDAPRTGQCSPTPSFLEEIVLLEIEARLRRMAMGIAENRQINSPTDSQTPLFESPVHRDRGMRSVEAIAQFISKNFRRDLDIREIAEAAFLHPNYAMVLFRKHTGITISQYVTLQRIAHAQRRLATSSDSISVIAIDSGFGSISRFYESFRHQTGISPRRFRLGMKSPY